MSEKERVERKREKGIQTQTERGREREEKRESMEV
jgi:hypothetical protein